MAKWEAIDRNGETHSGDGKEQLQVLLDAGTLQAGDGLHDEPRKKWTTVGQYLAVPAGRGRKPSAPEGPPAPLGRRETIMLSTLGVVILLAALFYAFGDYLLPGADPVATPTGVMPAATTPTALAGPHDGNRDGERVAAVAAGEEYNVLIESVGARGDGLTHVRGMVVFVPEAREGEKLRVRITEVRRTTAQAEKIGPATGPVEVANQRQAEGGSNAAPAAGDGDRPKPVEIGKVYNVTIDSVGSRGDGVAHIEGLVVFVPGTQPGQQVKIRVTDIGARAAKAEVVR